MRLQDELDNLSTNIASFQAAPPVSDAAWQDFADNCVVALMAFRQSSMPTHTLIKAKPFTSYIMALLKTIRKLKLV